MNRRRTGTGLLVFAAAAIAACATGEEPDRSGLEAGIGGASSSSSGPGGPGSSSSSVSSSAGPGSSNGNSSSASSTGAGGQGGAGGEGGAGGQGGQGGSVNDAGSDGPTPTGLRLQYKAADTNLVNPEIKPHFNLINDSPDSVALSELSIRYWYTIDGGSQVQQFHCDYAKIGCGKVTGTFGAQADVNADHYVELTFAAGEVLASGTETGEIQARFNKSDFASFDESNDYSFDATKLAFADWMKVALYHNGTLIWGAEP